MAKFGTAAGAALMIGPAVVETLRQLHVLEGHQPELTIVFGLVGGAVAVYLLKPGLCRGWKRASLKSSSVFIDIIVNLH